MKWLLGGDVSIQYQVHRDLLDTDKKNMRNRISSDGWGAQLLSFRNEKGHWGKAFYQPKWTSTHYTLLELKYLGVSPRVKSINETLSIICNNNKCADGGIIVSENNKRSDVCIAGMFLNYASYFRTDEDDLKSIIDFLISEQMEDGGFNCHSNTIGAVHSSLHTTLSVLEGILEYSLNDYTYRLKELKKIEAEAIEFILRHKLYQSCKTGEIIKPNFLLLRFPCRWYYDILKALDYFQAAKAKYDDRMEPAINILLKKRRDDGRWHIQGKHSGHTHFDMESGKEPSRWNTLRALRVLKHFNISE